MNAQAYIEQLRKRQPELFKAAKIQIKVISFEEALRAAFAAGEASAAEAHGKEMFNAIFPGIGLGEN
jgi:hypothetical protein